MAFFLAAFFLAVAFLAAFFLVVESAASSAAGSTTSIISSLIFWTKCGGLPSGESSPARLSAALRWLNSYLTTNFIAWLKTPQYTFRRMISSAFFRDLRFFFFLGAASSASATFLVVAAFFLAFLVVAFLAVAFFLAMFDCLFIRGLCGIGCNLSCEL